MNQLSSSPKSRVPVTARGAKTRERLLRAAESVFAERGFDQSSIAEIVSRGGAALGTFYVYFPDKKSVFIELVDDLGRRLRRTLADATRGLTDRLAVERAGLISFFHFAAEHRGLYRIVRQAEFVDEPTFRRYYSELSRGYTAGLAGAMETGQIRKLDAECLAYALMGMADFLGMRWVLWSREDDDVGAMLESAVEFMQYGLARHRPEGEGDREPRAAKRRAR
jgi:AcrR family transcriptional regulator